MSPGHQVTRRPGDDTYREPAAEAISAVLLLGLAGLGAYLAGDQSNNLEGGWRAAAVVTLVAAASAAVASWLWRAAEATRFRAWRRALLALVIAFGASVAIAGRPAVFGWAALTGFVAAPELRVLGRVWSDRRALGHHLVYPEGLPGAWLGAGLGVLILVVVGSTVLGPVRGALLGGLAAAAWALAVAPRLREPTPRRRALCMLAVLPAAVLAAAFGAISPLVIALVAAPALGWLARVGPAGLVAPLVAASLSLVGVLVFGAPTARQFVLVRTQNLEGSTHPIVFVRHRSMGVRQVIFAGMRLYTGNTDPRLVDDLVHPAMSVAASRARVLLVGGDCTGVPRELARYSDVKSLDIIELYPGADQACREFPAIARALGPKVAGRRLRGLKPSLTTLARQGARYDVVLVLGADPPRLPATLHSGGFYGSLRGLLAPEGVLAARLGSFRDRTPMLCGLSRLRESFPNVLPYHVFQGNPAGSVQHLVALATPRPLQTKDVRFSVPLRTGDEATFRAATHFPSRVKFFPIPEPRGGCAAGYRRRRP